MADEIKHKMITTYAKLHIIMIITGHSYFLSAPAHSPIANAGLKIVGCCPVLLVFLQDV